MLHGQGTLPESPHPLTAALVAAVAPGARILLLGIGNARHLRALLEAEHSVDVVEEDTARAAEAAMRWADRPSVRIARARYTGPLPFATRYDGALSTHALLHGSPAAVAASLAAVGNRLRAGAPFHFTLGSKRDPRFGRGTRIDDDTWAPQDGSEAGVAHVYFDEAGVRRLLAGWNVAAFEERSASQTAGRWAHGDAEVASMVHWFVRARR